MRINKTEGDSMGRCGCCITSVDEMGREWDGRGQPYNNNNNNNTNNNNNNKTPPDGGAAWR